MQNRAEVLPVQNQHTEKKQDAQQRSRQASLHLTSYAHRSHDQRSASQVGGQWRARSPRRHRRQSSEESPKIEVLKAEKRDPDGEENAALS
jgi:hypothetical protein